MIFKYIVFFSFLGVVAAQKSTTEILDLWNELDRNFTVDTSKNVILIVGPSGSGKSTLTLLLADAHVVSEETSPGNKQFVFRDFNGKIGQSTQDSHTTIPEPVMDPELDAAYYDCPGFEDTRAGYEVPVAYLIRKLLTNVKSFKIVLLMNRSVVDKGGYRHNFPKLVEYVIMLLKDIDRYKDIIAMVATKVENTPSSNEATEATDEMDETEEMEQEEEYKEEEPPLADDAELIEEIESYLLEERDGAIEKLKTKNLSHKDKKINEQKVKLLDILSKRNPEAPNGFERIGIFRTAMEAGTLDNMKEIQKNKREIKTMIRDNLKYLDNNGKADIGYVVSSKAKNEINQLIDEILYTKLDEGILNVCKQMKNNYAQIFEKVTEYEDLIKLHDTAIKTLNSISTSGPLKFATELIKFANQSNPNITIDKVENHIKYVNFLLNVNYRKLTISSKLTNHRNEVTKYVTSLYEMQIKSWVNRLFDVQLPKAISPVLNAIDQFYSEIESETDNLQQLRNNISDGYQTLNQVSVSDPQTLVKAIKKWGIGLSNDITRELNNVVKNLASYKSMEKKPPALTEKSEAILEKTKDKLKNANVWYDFVIEIHDDICSNDCKNTEVKSALINGLSKNVQSAVKVGDIAFGKLKDCTKKKYTVLRDIESLKLDSRKRNALATVLSNALENPTITCSDNKLNMTVTGKIVKISAVVADKNCWNTATFVKIFARDSVIVDSDVSKFGSKKDLAIMAPVWSITGQRKFSFKGADGQSKGRAKDGEVKNKSPGHADHGEVGNPGGPAGSFLAIGDVFINGAGLTIESKGGKGGPGQNGGNGANGVDAAEPSIELSNWNTLDVCFDASYLLYSFGSPFIWIVPSAKRELDWNCMKTFIHAEKFPPVDWSFWSRPDKKFTKTGEPGIAGGDGGNGGEGGKGGKRGRIDIFELGKPSYIKEDKKDGEKGAMGLKGTGGHGAIRSYIMELYIKDSWLVGVPGVRLECNTEVYPDTHEKMTRSGNDGTDGSSNKNRHDPDAAGYLFNPSSTIDEFKNFMKENSKNTFRESDVKNFLSRLEKDKEVRQLYKKN